MKGDFDESNLLMVKIMAFIGCFNRIHQTFETFGDFRPDFPGLLVTSHNNGIWPMKVDYGPRLAGKFQDLSALLLNKLPQSTCSMSFMCFSKVRPIFSMWFSLQTRANFTHLLKVGDRVFVTFVAVLEEDRTRKGRQNMG